MTTIYYNDCFNKVFIVKNILIFLVSLYLFNNHIKNSQKENEYANAIFKKLKLIKLQLIARYEIEKNGIG